LWDLRKTNEKNPKPVHVVNQYTGTPRRYGVSSLALDSTGSRLLVSYTNSKICMYDSTIFHDSSRNFKPKAKQEDRALSKDNSGAIDGEKHDRSPRGEPLQCYQGHQNASFYVKATFSPDDQFVVSGSCDHNIYIWEVILKRAIILRTSFELPHSSSTFTD
jgi:WD40 repeat protein